jgi:hypothetical protein
LNKRVVYTANFGSYDQLTDLPLVIGTDYICFSDHLPTNTKGWDIRTLIFPPDMSDAKKNRYCKFHSHILLEAYEEVIYIDSNVQLIEGYDKYFSCYNSHDLVLFAHPHRLSVNSEIAACLNASKITYEIECLIRNRYKKYLDSSSDNWLSENRVFYRKNSSDQVSKLFEFIWDEYCAEIHRDQIIMPFACHNHSFTPNFFEFMQSDVAYIFPHRNENIITKFKYFYRNFYYKYKNFIF